MIKNVMLFIGGAVTGAVITYISVVKYYVDKNQEIINTYEERLKKLEKDAETVKSSEEEETLHMDKVNTTEIDYTSFYKPDQPVPNDIPLNANTYDQYVKDNFSSPYEDSDPVLITEAAYEEKANEGYEVIETSYYIDDDMLFFSDDEVVEDIDRLIGESNLIVFAKTNASKIFVLNEEYGQVICVIKRHGPCPMNNIEY